MKGANGAGIFNELPLVKMIRGKHLERWLPAYLRARGRRLLAPLTKPSTPLEGPRHLLFAFCDHYEPRWKSPGAEVADARVETWRRGYPALCRDFRDADGHAPRHSFFFPTEEYDARHLDVLADLARQGLGEVEVHIHHDGDTAASLKAKLEEGLGRFASHGHLSRMQDKVRYAFIHGNWCLANARADGRWCGVDNELEVLFETGCYADYTFPAAPDESQAGIVNQIYWPVGDLGRRRAFDRGEEAKVGRWHDDRLLIIEGPLALTLRSLRRPLPRIENANVTAHDPPTPWRLRSWVTQDIHVEGRPEWVFVKVHTHGAQEAQAGCLLGPPGRALHEELARTYNDGVHWKLHYVTAREMYNIAMAAMQGQAGDPGLFRDFIMPPPPAAGAV